MTPNLASSPRRNRRATVFFSLLLPLVMLLAACGGTTPTTTTSNHATTLRVQWAPGQPVPDLFNPFFNANQGGAWGAQGLLYDELYFTNLYNGQHTPWLANSYQYNSDLTQLTFTIRPGVKWNDGQPFTSADVLFTFNLMQAHPALDQNSIWASTLKSLAAPDPNTVVFTLQAPDSTALFYIGGTFIVPQHVSGWTTGDPAKFANDKNPVGTGPYLLSSFNSDQITYTRNPNFWGNSVGMTPQVQTIQAVATKDNTTTITNMIQGQYDWTGVGWSPDFDSQYKAKDPQHNQDWFAASNTVMLYLNLQKAPFNNLLVRKAISAAINRDQLPQGVALYAKVANPTGVIIPNLNSWIASQYQSAGFQYSASQAGSYLQQA
ncbi:MAG TPA: ABC transporter substrate-binding protein, partial [Ktedonobacteraceae bacterium]|nr:ABC transporter substrate-binding protein [Ktedonobacteraceae bacterium]